MIYLAGPINGCSDDEATNWRDLAKERLGAENCLDPMRRDYRGIEDENTDEIVEGDKLDILAADVVLANCWQVSWGTAMEIYYAWSQDSKVIAVVPPGARISPWLRYHTVAVVRSLADAIEIIRGD